MTQTRKADEYLTLAVTVMCTNRSASEVYKVCSYSIGADKRWRAVRHGISMQVRPVNMALLVPVESKCERYCKDHN